MYLTPTNTTRRIGCTPSGAPSTPGRRLSTKLSFCLLAAVIIRCCRWQKGLTVSQEHAFLRSLPLSLTWLHVVRCSAFLARIVGAAMLRAGDEHSCPARLSAGEEHCLMAFLRSVSAACVFRSSTARRQPTSEPNDTAQAYGIERPCSSTQA